MMAMCHFLQTHTIMKKYFFIAIAAVALTFTSCSKDPVEKTKDYCEQMLKAYEEGDTEKGDKIKEEADEWEKTLSEEDKQKVKDYMESEEGEKWATEYAAKLFAAALKQEKKK